MRSIVCINTNIPTVEDQLDYNFEGSLRDYDISIFNPELPYYTTIDFSGGGSAISIEGTAEFIKASSHWALELKGALAVGKTVFVLLNKYEETKAAYGTAIGARNNRNYKTTAINNYSAVPYNIGIRNARGRGIVVKDAGYKILYDTIKEIVEYRVVLEDSASFRSTFVAKDGTAIGGVASVVGLPGSLVLLPYFDFEAEGFSEYSEKEGEEVWTKKALQISHAVVGQLVEIDRMLRGSSARTPAPDWLKNFQRPKAADEIENTISEIDVRIEELGEKRAREMVRRADVLEYSHLLYETGKPLEQAIEKVLRLLDYKVETLRLGDLEIDHVIVGPSGLRMIGEAEGKDTSAIDISKFRQLESNIGEDFEREEINEPAKGILFGNGFRLSDPLSRAGQFTQKSLKNARRLGSALICTADLYAVALRLLDHPEDDTFKDACRAAIENAVGGIVQFPIPLSERQPDDVSVDG